LLYLKNDYFGNNHFARVLKRAADKPLDGGSLQRMLQQLLCVLVTKASETWLQWLRMCHDDAGGCSTKL